MKPCRWMLLPLLTLLLPVVSAQSSAPGALPVKAQDGAHAPDRPAAVDPIDDALRGREYAVAIQKIDEALKTAPAEQREYLLYRRGLAFFLTGKQAEAIAQFDAQVKEFPAGLWRSKALFRKADAHAALKQFDAAEAIYAAAVRELVGDARKAKIAQVYLDFAGDYFAPKDNLIKPDFARAKVFYDKALELEPGEELRDTILFRRALCSARLGAWNDAVPQFEQYLLVFDPATREWQKQRNAGAPLPPAAAKPGAHLLDARLELAAGYQATGRVLEARRTLRDLVALIDSAKPDADAAKAKCRATWLTAMVRLAQTYGIPNPADNASLTLGVQALGQLIAREPGSKEAIDAAFQIGQAYAARGRTDEALAAYAALLNRTEIKPTDDDGRKLAETRSQEALFATGQLLVGQRKYADAIGAWNQYIAKYPSGPQWSASQQAIIDAEYRIGFDALQDRKWDDCKAAWESFIQKYPLDGRVPGILLAFANVSRTEQKRLSDDGKAADWNAPIALYRKVVSKYPGTEEAGQAQLVIGIVYETELKDLEKAIEEYGRLNWSSAARVAQQRISEMRATRLRVITERTFRTNETPHVKVDLRNVDKLTVKLYRIDMQDYFRKRYSLGGVEQLDLLLIDPDQTLEITPMDYGKYKPITQDIDLPVQGPGAWAVVVSNETSKMGDVAGVLHQKLESATLVIRSDVDIIVKSSRKQLMVFAEDMRSGKPAEGVDILAASNGKVFLSGKTGADGVWLAKSDTLKDSPAFTVLADRGGNVAGTNLSLDGLGFSSGLQPRGYIYPDRPAYKPGEAVNIRGILREVKDGQYALPTRPEDPRLRWKLDVVDSKGRVLQTQELRFSDYGSFAAQFDISSDAPVGGYKLIARRPDGPTFAGEFLVQTFELPKAWLRVELDNAVVLRGEKIKGAIVAKYQYGEPVAGKTIAYYMQLPTGEQIHLSGVTDDKGRVPFEFDSAVLPEEARIGIVATQAELAINATGVVNVAVRAFSADLKTQRPLYLSEEQVEVSVTTRDLLGKPIEESLTITAALRTQAGGQWSEVKANSAEVKTDAKTGIARASFKLSKGGFYVLRAEGKDKFGHVVTAEGAVTISGADDATRVRIFSDRETYKVGEKIALDIHSRLGGDAKNDSRSDKEKASASPPPLALLTYEGEEIIGYKIVPIAFGHNAQEIAVANEHFPNFSVGVSVMDGHKFYAATREFQVERQLNIVMTPSRATLRPRDELKLDILVTDHLGKPVQGEIGLAMIDNALLTRFPDATPNIVEFFQSAARRQSALRSDSSCTFSYAPQTRPMVTEVLAEAARMEDQVAEKELAANDGLFLLEIPTGSPAASPAPARPGLAGGGRLADGERKDKAGAKLRSSVAAGKPRGGGGDQAAGDPAGAWAEDVEHEVAELGFDGDVSVVRTPGAAENLSYGYQLGYKARGIYQAFGQAQDDEKATERLGKQLNRLVSSAPPRSYFPTLAYWNPCITTDAAGKAGITIVMPDSSTTWKFIARGVTKETLVGGGEAEVVAKNDFFAEVIVPPTLLEADTFQPQARVHCLTAYSGKIDVTLDVTRDGKPVAKQTRTLDVKASGVYDVAFDALPVGAPGTLTFGVTATTQSDAPDAKKKLADTIAAAVTIRPWGMRVEEARSGIGKDSDFVELALPSNLKEYRDVTLSVTVGASMPRWLIEEALETGPRWRGIDERLSGWRIAPPRTNADTAAMLIGCLYAANYVRARGERESADMRLLSDRIAGLTAQLLAAQHDDGGLAWCGNGGSDPWTTAQAAWALGKARQDGYSVADAAVSRMEKYLKGVFSGAGTDQTELKAVVLFGVSWIGNVDFAHVNRLHRNRDALSSPALAYLVLTLERLDRRPMAAELLSILQSRLREEKNGTATCKALPSGDCSAWMQSELETTALALLGQLDVDPRNASVEPMVNYLAAAARMHGWDPHKARGAVLAALSTYFGSAKSAAAAYALDVSVNGKPVGKVTSDDPESFRIDIPAAQLADGKQRVDFQFAGRGEYAFSVALAGFTNSYPKPIRDRGEALWVGARWYFPPALEYKGREITAGFGATARSNWFRNGTSHASVGEVIRVQSDLGRYDERSRSKAGDADYLIARETIPTGFRLVPNSVSGPFLAYDVADNVITFYFGAASVGVVNYALIATTEGVYRIPPTRLQSLYRPDRYNLNGAEQVFTILPRGTPSPEPYRKTPDELYNLARMNYDDGNYAATGALLRELLDARDWMLNDDPYRESIRMLLTVALKADNAGDTVNYFEILKEKYPALVVPYEEIVRVAAAYAKTDQHERAWLIYRAIADSSFANDTAVGGVLQENGRFLEGIDYLERLWLEFPDTPQVESIYYAMSQTLYAQADKAVSIAQRRQAKVSIIDAAAKAKEPPSRVTRVAVIQETIELLERFLALYPESPIADEASYSLANAYLDLNQFHTVLARTDRMIQLYPKSRWLDKFKYIQAFAQFNLGNFEQARTLAQQVANATYRDAQGVERPSENRFLALYIIGQIYHAQGETAKALEYYKKVREQFADAGEAARYFEHAYVKLPEVTIFHPDGAGFREADEWQRYLRMKQAAGAAAAGFSTGSSPGSSAESSTGWSAGSNGGSSGGSSAGPKFGAGLRQVSATTPLGAASAPLYPAPFVDLGFRNVKSAVIQVYRVDLMKLALMEKNLSEIASVNLAGIKPLIEKTVALGDGMDYEDKDLRIDLDLIRKAEGASKSGAGAYLVICRGDEHFSSGLVLVTPLALDVQEEPGSRRVRVNVVDAITRGGVKNVHVKVIGMGQQQFVAGESDLRGVFIADGVSTYPTAIARDATGDFAFYRSEGALLALAAAKNPPPAAEPPADRKLDYLENLRNSNREIQSQNDARMQQLYKAPQQRGVEVQKSQ